jgi:L-rhamnose mutarotase|tara:strand:+ start:391 stop:954 length:564 start_codon:yes stop_codon:yes gene_type:complete
MKKIFTVILLLIISCKSHYSEHSNSLIKECLKDHKNISFQGIRDFSIYNTYENIEKILIKENRIKKGEKKTYINLLKLIQTDKKLKLKLKESIKREVKNYDLLDEPSIGQSPFNCVRYCLNNGEIKMSNSLKKHKKAYDDILKSLILDDVSSNIKFIESTPDNLFKYFDFRLPVLALIYLNLTYDDE